MPRRSGRRTGISTRPTRLRLECDRVQDEPPGVLVYIGAPRCREPSQAFSREPPCDSVGALAVRQTPETRGTAWEFSRTTPYFPHDTCEILHNLTLVHIKIVCEPNYKVMTSTKFTPPTSWSRATGFRFARIIFFSQFPAK
ncbi:hypothetical protein LSM04_001216 [Trypanosoma melophagium]|nr:hypothetical protein LSM04_001216 [Trypanosoma melophagium]